LQKPAQIAKTFMKAAMLTSAGNGLRVLATFMESPVIETTIAITGKGKTNEKPSTSRNLAGF